MRHAVRTAAELYLAAGAEMVLAPFPDARPIQTPSDLDQFDHLRVRPAATPMISAHPQGTCRMGPDPAASVVGLDLRVHGMENLQVLDASVFPTSASTHTMLPVMTFSWLGAHELV
jgi:choline dehydrogenase-like flavoprotein